MVEQLLTGELFGTYAPEKCGICGGISNPIPYHTVPWYGIERSDTTPL